MSVFKRRWFMWDFARLRRFERKEFLMVATKLAELGYNGIGLYLEGAFELKSIGGGILRRGIMTREDAAWAKEKCQELGVFLFPMTNVVGHMEHFLRQERFKYFGANLRQRYTDIGSLDIKFSMPEAEEFALKILDEYLDAFGTDYIHVGGDEVILTEQTRPIYAEFLSGICNKLLRKGIKPAIWNDLLWAHKELVSRFSRDIEMFDWHYFGHRPESIEFFNNEGFKNVIACPCENSWVGFINHQYVREWVKDDNHTPVAPDEVEAFLYDEIQKGDRENLCGMLTHWEATMGRDLWGQWSAIARAGLFMNGKLEYQTQNNEAIELALFGRITPYTEIMHIIQDEIHSVFQNVAMASHIRTALFLKQEYLDTATEALNKGRDLLPLVDGSIRRIDSLLSTWVSENDFEEYCKQDLVSVSALMKASFALNSAFSACGRLYTEASKKQFDDAEAARDLVQEFADGFVKAAELIKAYRATIAVLIRITGHTETDLVKLDTILGYTEELAEFLKNLINDPGFGEIPLPAMEIILDWVLDRAVIEK